MTLLKKWNTWTCVSKAKFCSFSLSIIKYVLYILEVLRKYPVLPFLDRKTVTDYNIPGTDVVIEKDTPVFIPILALHNDPRYFANPEVFDPERFSKTNVNNIEHFVYMPFGEGPRNCIGMPFKCSVNLFLLLLVLTGSRFGKLTTKLGLAYILKSFVVEKTCFTEAKIRFNPKGVALSPLRGMKLKLRKV
jgi:cytochrome P450 family 6